MDEFSLIKQIKEKLKMKNDGVVLGIGDDAAVLVSPKGHLLSTTDCLVESVHFDLSFITPEELGHKALAVNLSDIAAMGGTALYALVSLGIREGISEDFILKMFEGMKRLSDSFHVAIVGGNITHSPEKLFIDVTLMGEAETFWARSGAKAGDLIAVTGSLGAAALGWECLKKDGVAAKNKYPFFTRAHLTPSPRLLEAEALKKVSAVTSAIDISDGLSSELHHLAEASQQGMEINEALLPFAPELEKTAFQFGKDPLDLVLNGGEVYELLVTLSTDKAEKAVQLVKDLGTQMTIIGKVVSTHGVTIESLKGKKLPLKAKGWNHLKNKGAL